MHVRVELLDAAVDDHGRSLDAEVPRDLGTLLDVGPEGFRLCGCTVDLIALVPLPQVLLDRLCWTRRNLFITSNPNINSIFLTDTT